MKISVYEIAEKLNDRAIKENKKVNIHIELDTGMGRTGINPREAEIYVEKMKKLTNLNIEGIFTHFASADSNPEYTELQIKIFNETVEKLQKQGIDFKYIHSSASSGIINYLEKTKSNLIRPGIIIYGYMPSEEILNKIGVKPTAVLKTKVVFLKTVEKGTSISYGNRYITQRESKIATIPIGYADGIRRSLSNKGRVYIKGEYAPIIGSVCMDNFMVDVTHIKDVCMGDKVTLIGNDGNENITVEELGLLADKFNYEFVCGLSKRIPRTFVKNKKVIGTENYFEGVFIS